MSWHSALWVGMIAPSSLLASLLIDPETLKVLVSAKQSTCYVGESVPLSVEVVVSVERPTLSPPTVEGGDLTLLKTEMKPVGGAGEVERNLFKAIYELIPRRPGNMTIAPIRARLSGRSGASSPLKIEVKPPPLSGRPRTFLGGVGDFEVEADAEPTSIRVGGTLEFRVTLRGPGARGSTGVPDISRLTKTPLGLSVESLPAQVVLDPPSRTFVYQLRPTRAGAGILPPVAIAAFNPKTERYVTKVTAGIPIHVSEAPTLDPSMVHYEKPVVQNRGFSAWRVGSFVLAASLVMAIAIALRNSQTRRNTTVKAITILARETAARYQSVPSLEERGRVINDGFVAYLALAIARPEGALTPEEAVLGVIEATDSETLGRAAGMAVFDCDQAQFHERLPELAAERLSRSLDQALQVFQQLSKTPLTVAKEAERVINKNDDGFETQ